MHTCFICIYYVCSHVCVYVHMCSSAFRGQKKVLNALQLEVQDVASHPMGVLGSEFRSFTEGCLHLINT